MKSVSIAILLTAMATSSSAFAQYQYQGVSPATGAAGAVPGYQPMGAPKPINPRQAGAGSNSSSALSSTPRQAPTGPGIRTPGNDSRGTGFRLPSQTSTPSQAPSGGAPTYSTPRN